MPNAAAGACARARTLRAAGGHGEAAAEASDRLAVEMQDGRRDRRPGFYGAIAAGAGSPGDLKARHPRSPPRYEGLQA